MLSLEFHERIAIPSLLHIGLVVLAANGQNHTVVGQLDQGPLPVRKSLTGIVAAQLDAVNAILTEDPTPQGVIEVEHEAFLALQSQSSLHLLPPILEIVCQFGIDQGL